MLHRETNLLKPLLSAVGMEALTNSSHQIKTELACGFIIQNPQQHILRGKALQEELIKQLYIRMRIYLQSINNAFHNNNLIKVVGLARKHCELLETQF